MEVSSSQQMYEMQTRAMNGSGGGQGGGQMKEIMQSLPQDQRASFREELSLLSPQDRQSLKAEMAAIDTAALSSEDLSQTLADLLANYKKPEATSENILDLYA